MQIVVKFLFGRFPGRASQWLWPRLCSHTIMQKKPLGLSFFVLPDHPSILFAGWLVIYTQQSLSC
jgi:hypothetical protein